MTPPPVVKTPLTPHHPSVIEYVTSPEIAHGYDSRHAGNRLFELDTAFLDAALPPLGRVLDLGCGTGRHLVHLARRGHDVTGVDLSEHMLKVASEKLTCSGLRARLLRLDFCGLRGVPSGSFDAAIMMFGTFCLLKDDRARLRALSEVSRVLKENGAFCLHVHARGHEFLRLAGWGRLIRSGLGALVGNGSFGDKWMRGYRGLDGLFLHLFGWGEIKALLSRAGLDIEREWVLDRSGAARAAGGLQRLFAGGYLVSARKTGVRR